MAERNSYHVVPGDDGWKAERDGSSRASSVRDTQAAAIDAARGYLSRSGGGELNIHGKDNKIRAKDTIDPGNDPGTLRDDAKMIPLVLAIQEESRRGFVSMPNRQR